MSAGIAGAMAGVATTAVTELTRIAITGGKVSWGSVAIGGIQGGIYGYGEGLSNQARANAFTQKYKLDNSPNSQRFSNTVQAMRNGVYVTDSDRYWATDFGMQQLGATAEERQLNLRLLQQKDLFPEISDAEYKANLLQKQNSQTINANTFSDMNIRLDDIQVTSQRATQFALGSARVDSIAIGTGDLVQEVSQTIQDKPWLRYSIEVLDVVAAPVAYAARKVVDGT